MFAKPKLHKKQEHPTQEPGNGPSQFSTNYSVLFLFLLRYTDSDRFSPTWRTHRHTTSTNVHFWPAMGIYSTVRGEKEASIEKLISASRDEHFPARHGWHNVGRDIAISPRADRHPGPRHVGGFLASEWNYGIAKKSGGCDKDDGLGHQPRLRPSLDLLATPEVIPRFVTCVHAGFTARNLPNCAS
jgi:hypothetical protein